MLRRLIIICVALLMVSCTNEADKKPANSDTAGANKEVLKRQSEISIFEAKLIDATERIQTIKRRSDLFTGEDTLSYRIAMDSLEIKKANVMAMVDELKESSAKDWQQVMRKSERLLEDLVLTIENMEKTYMY